MKEIKITEKTYNQRIDKFVRKYLNEAPLSFIYKLFRKKDVKINGHWVKENYILQNGDILRIFVTDEQLSEFNKPKSVEDLKITFKIIYEDENILIVNKPKGILIHGDETEKRITLSNMVLSYLYKNNEYNPNGEGFTPAPCHRLDRNTSGLVIYAKNLESSQILMDLFKTHESIHKSYIALLDGVIDKNGKIEAPLLKDSSTGFVKVSSADRGAKKAITEYELISHNNKYSLVEANLITGRTHQLRVHFAYINHPILGDQKYGNFAENKLFDERFNYHYQFLHAYKVVFDDVPGRLKYLSNKCFIADLFSKDVDILKKLNLNLDKLS